MISRLNCVYPIREHHGCLLFRHRAREGEQAQTTGYQVKFGVGKKLKEGTNMI